MKKNFILFFNLLSFQVLTYDLIIYSSYSYLIHMIAAMLVVSTSTWHCTGNTIAAR